MLYQLVVLREKEGDTPFTHSPDPRGLLTTELVLLLHSDRSREKEDKFQAELGKLDTWRQVCDLPIVCFVCVGKSLLSLFATCCA